MTRKIWAAVGFIVLLLVIGTLTLMVIDRKSRADTYSLRELDAAVALQSPDGRMAPPSTGYIAAPVVPPGVVQSNIPGGGIGVTAAPGVAFSYRYAFRLPNANIAGVQEQHAQACEKLGIDRCRITGMRYTVSAKDDVRAMLAFKLAPDLARQFGKDGITAIQKAQGSLVDAAISGDDVGSGIEQSRRRSASIETRIRALESRLKQSSLGRVDQREDIEQQIVSLREALERESQNRADAGEALANTPMIFQYNSGSALSTSALGEAWTTATSSFVAIIGLFIIAVGVLAPWALLAAVGLLLYRRFPKREPKAVEDDHAQEPVMPTP